MPQAPIWLRCSRGVNAFDPKLHLDVRIDLSVPLIDALPKGKFDAVIVRRERHQRGGETLFEDSFGWFAAPAFQRIRPVRSCALPCWLRLAVCERKLSACSTRPTSAGWKPSPVEASPQ